ALPAGVREGVPRDRGVPQTLERVTALGGVAAAAHPYRFWSGLGKAAVVGAPFAAYASFNARTLRGGNARAQALARERGVGQTGGSDSHFLDEVARAVTVIDAGMLRADDVVQILGAGRTSAEGQNRGAAATVRYVSKAVGWWSAGGLRRI